MPNFQKPRAIKLHEEALELYELAANASEPEKSHLLARAAEKERQADVAEHGWGNDA